MRGSESDVRDIVLDLHELVLPQNLLSSEVLETEEEEPEPEPGRYRVVTCCNLCHSPLRLFIESADEGQVRIFHQLLLDGLGILCAVCYRTHCCDGRRR
ncbi:E7 [Canis familiaris papillomavirus 7]|uniref:Protein E7 n=1 Tax=Canis familiaris papillomavirus 7 TaxID=2759772 RepID=C8YJJ9_9PAPI|nr:E7 [Canis familiaris papillomavirus 7]